MTSSVWLVRLEDLEKSLRYALEHWTGNLCSKVGPIPTNTGRVLSIRADFELESMVYSLECNRKAQQVTMTRLWLGGGSEYHLWRQCG